MDTVSYVQDETRIWSAKAVATAPASDDGDSGGNAVATGQISRPQADGESVAATEADASQVPNPGGAVAVRIRLLAIAAAARFHGTDWRHDVFPSRHLAR